MEHLDYSIKIIFAPFVASIPTPVSVALLKEDASPTINKQLKTNLISESLILFWLK
jgi:hypothetical protein